MDTCFSVDAAGLHDGGAARAPFPRSLDERDRRALRSSIACWSELDGRRRVVLDEARAIIACDPEFVSFVVRNREFQIHNGRFGPTDQRLAEALTSFPAQSSETRNILVPRASGSHWICCAARLTEYGNLALVGIAIRSAGEEHEPIWPDFRAAFGLSAIDHDILVELLAGRSALTIARRHALSDDQVHAHVARLYAKLGVDSEHALWRKLCSYRLR